MRQILILEENTFVSFKDDTFIIPTSEKFEIEIKSAYDCKRMKFTFSNGNTTTTVNGLLACQDVNIIEIPKALLKAGILNLTICLYSHGEILKKWINAPISIKESDGELRLSDFLKKLEIKQAELEARITELESKNSNLFKL